MAAEAEPEEIRRAISELIERSEAEGVFVDYAKRLNRAGEYGLALSELVRFIRHERKPHLIADRLDVFRTLNDHFSKDPNMRRNGYPLNLSPE